MRNQESVGGRQCIAGEGSPVTLPFHSIFRVSQENSRGAQLTVVIPCYNVADHIEQVIRSIPEWVATIIVVDDRSPDAFLNRVQRLADSRVVVVRHEHNQGVGGAMVSGYREALSRGADVVIKMDGDGQMDPDRLPELLKPLFEGRADYVKGNRWHDLGALESMPPLRRWGNTALSFLTKVASGYWSVFDPCNGFTAIRADVLRQIPLERISRDFFFETSMLVELSLINAVVNDVPIPARYGDERSTLRIKKIVKRFPLALTRSLLRRVWQRHFVRQFGPISIFLCGAAMLMSFAILFGVYEWLHSAWTGEPRSAGTVMLAALPFLMGFQMLLQAVVMDVGSEPKSPITKEEPLSGYIMTHAARGKSAA